MIRRWNLHEFSVSRSSPVSQTGKFVWHVSLRLRLVAFGVATVAALAAVGQASERWPEADRSAAAGHRVLIIGQGPDGHPPTTHEFMAGAVVLQQLLQRDPNLKVSVVKAVDAWEEGPQAIDQADAVVLLVTQGSAWMQEDAERYRAFERLAQRGGGLIALHWSVGAKEGELIAGQLALLGATRGGPQRKYQFLSSRLSPVADAHPILSGIEPFEAFDEFYYALDRQVDVQPLLSAEIDGESEMVAWAWESPTQARAFGFTGLHFHSNWQLPEYRRLIVQGVRWCLRQPIPTTGVDVDIASEWLELDGELPMAASPAAIEWSKQLQAEQRLRQRSARQLLDRAMARFSDGIRHYQNEHRQHDYARYRDDQIEAIAENICRHQRDTGGWPKNWDPLRRLAADELARLEADRGKLDSTLDNRTSYPQVQFLAAAYQLTGELRFREAAVRGIEYLLAAQGTHGGWPHAYPDRSGYNAYITFNDAVTVGVLETLTRIADSEPVYAFVPEPLRERVAEAVAAGQACLLRLQLVVDGVPTAWAQQYDPQTLVPVTARTYELPGIAAAESVGVVRYLMSLPDPSAEVIESVEHAVAWFRSTAIHGKRIEQVPIEPVQFRYHTARWDRVEVDDPDAPPIWARFYDLESNRPFMANRDGTKVYRLADVELERRTGYGWYTGAPGSLLEEDYPAWKARFDHASAGR